MSECWCECVQLICVSAWLSVYVYIHENHMNHDQIYEDVETLKDE